VRPPVHSMSHQQLPWMVVAVTTAITALPVTFAAVGTPGLPPLGRPLVPLVLGMALLGLQLWHSMVAARGDRPRHGSWTLLAVAALVYLPLFRYGYSWTSAQASFGASALMVLPGAAGRLAAAAPIVGTAIFVPIDDYVRFPSSTDTRAATFDVIYWLVGLTSLTVVLYGASWLVRSLADLLSTPTELAELAIGQERLRISHDLHDLLGQSLSAVSLKGELALRLLPQHPVLARAEVEGLTAVAREALHGVRAVTRGSHVITLQAEVESASRLLEAALVRVEVDLYQAALPSDVEEVFAWAVREAATNVLRHSEAKACHISTCRQGDRVLLTVDNDGVIQGGEPGIGLTGLTQRARTRGGRLAAGIRGDGWFRLTIELPVRSS
jgi:two-component system sensor histidine kinase DesK